MLRDNYSVLSGINKKINEVTKDNDNVNKEINKLTNSIEELNIKISKYRK